MTSKLCIETQSLREIVFVDNFYEGIFILIDYIICCLGTVLLEDLVKFFESIWIISFPPEGLS
jgi:hypothetical protein